MGRFHEKHRLCVTGHDGSRRADAGVIPHGSNAKEFARLRAIGLSNAEAVRAATMHAARAVGLTDRTGALKEGMWADIVATAGNPLENIEVLERVSFVMKAGRIVKRD